MADNKSHGPLDTVGCGVFATPSKNGSDLEGKITLKGDLGDWGLVIGFGESGEVPVLLQELDPKG
jgi:hypothetical protein